MIGCSNKEKNHFVQDNEDMIVLSAKKWGEGYRYVITDGKDTGKGAADYGWELETKEIYGVGNIITISVKEQE